MADGALGRAAVTVAHARRQGREKFGDLAARLFFDDAGLQMATAAPVAAHRAARFPAGATVADLGCGGGGDALALACRGPVAAIEWNPSRALMARLNADAAGVGGRVIVCRGDALMPPASCDALFADPARRTAGGRRVRRGDDYEPPLAAIADWRRLAARLAVKVGPTLDESQWPEDVGEVEFVSWRRQCREAVLWFGSLATARRRASVVGAGSLAWDGDDLPNLEVGDPGPYLFEPDPAIVRSHLVGLLGRQLEACLLAPRVAYLSAARPAATPFARCFAVRERLPFSSRHLRHVLTSSGWRPTEVLRRHFPLEPEALLRELKGAGSDGATPVSLLCTRVRGRPVVFICEPLPQ